MNVMDDKSKKPANKIKLNRSQIREGLKQLPIESIIMGEGKKRTLTTKQKGFVRDVAMGKPKAQAYRDNYNTKTKKQYQGNEAHKLASNPQIANEIEAFKVALSAMEYHKGHQLKAFIMHQLTLHSLNEDNPPASRIRSLELLGKTYDVGLFVDRKEITTIKDSQDTKARLLEQLAQAMQKNSIELDDSGESLLKELESINLADDEAHYTPTPLIGDGTVVDNLHTIPDNQISNSDNQISDKKGGGGYIKNNEYNQEDDIETPPVNHLDKKEGGGI